MNRLIQRAALVVGIGVATLSLLSGSAFATNPASGYSIQMVPTTVSLHSVPINTQFNSSAYIGNGSGGRCYFSIMYGNIFGAAFAKIELTRTTGNEGCVSAQATVYTANSTVSGPLAHVGSGWEQAQINLADVAAARFNIVVSNGAGLGYGLILYVYPF
jgi:hypothetical protein